MFGEVDMKLKLCIITNLFKLLYSFSDLFLLWEVNGFWSIDPAARTSLIIPRGIIQIKHQMNLAILAKMCRKGFVDKTIVKIWRQILCVKCPKNKYVQLNNYFICYDSNIFIAFLYLVSFIIRIFLFIYQLYVVNVTFFILYIGF